MSTQPESNDKLQRCPSALQEIINDFQSVPPRERLEYLIEYSDDLPDLPNHLESDRESFEQVHECQSPVFLHTDLVDGQVQFQFDVAPEAPTVRGYAAILQEGFQNTTPDEVLQAPDDIYVLLGLNEAISPLRLRGLHALMIYMKRQVQNLV